MKLAVFATLVATTSAYSFDVRPKFDFKVELGQVTKTTAIAATLALTIASTTTPLPASAAGDLLAGKQIFNANCAACHVGGQNVIMPEKTLQKEALDQYLAGGRSEASVVTQVTYGKNAMPAFRGRLGDADIANVATYVIRTSEIGWDTVVREAVRGTTIVEETPVFAVNVEKGEQIFNNNCAVCHAGGQNVIMPEKTLEKEALDLYLAGGRSEASVVKQVTNGKNAMPAFGGRLGDGDIANVATFVIKSSEAGWDY